MERFIEKSAYYKVSRYSVFDNIEYIRVGKED